MLETVDQAQIHSKSIYESGMQFYKSRSSKMENNNVSDTHTDRPALHDTNHPTSNAVLEVSDEFNGAVEINGVDVGNIQDDNIASDTTESSSASLTVPLIDDVFEEF